MTSDGRRRVLAVLAIAASVRAAWIFAVPVIPVSDSCRYDLFARNLADGVGYSAETGPTAFWPVGPSFLFSLCYRGFGYGHDYEYLPIALMNLILGVGSVALTIHLGARWFAPSTGLLAGLLLALWPSQIEFTTVLSSETPFIFLLLLALAVWNADRPALWMRGALCGAVLAGACYMRPTAILLPIVFGACRIASHTDRANTAGATAVMSVVMLALIMPWSMRNYRVFEEFVLLSTNGGVNTWMGNNPETDGFYQKWPSVNYGGEVGRDHYLRSEAIAYIWKDLRAFTERTIVKAFRLYERETIGVHWNAEALYGRYPEVAVTVLKWVGQMFWLFVLVLAVPGVILVVKTQPLLRIVALPPLLVWLYFTAVHATTVIQDRYHFPVIPFVAMFASLFLVNAFRDGRGDHARRFADMPLRLA